MNLAEVFVLLGMKPDRPSFKKAMDEVKAQANEIQKYWKNLEKEQFGPKAPAWHKATPMFDKDSFLKQWLSPIKQAESAATDSANNVARSLTKLGAAGAIAGTIVSVFEQIASAAIGAAKSLAGIIEGAADAGIKINKLSVQMGLSKQATQEWAYVATQSGSSLQQFAVGLRMFERNLFGTEHGAKNKQFVISLKEMGISADQAGKILNSPDGVNEALFVMADRIKQLLAEGRKGEAAALAQKLFGARASEMLADLAQGGEKLREMVKHAHELGAVLSDEQIGNLKSLHNAIDDVKTQFSGMVNSVVADVAPMITGLLHQFTAWFAAHREQIKEILEFALKKLVEVARVVGHYLGVAFDWILANRAMIETTISNIAKAVIAWIEMMKPVFAALLAQFILFMSMVTSASEVFRVWYEAAALVVNDIISEVERLMEVIESIGEAIARPFEEGWDQIRSIFRRGIKDVEDMIEKMPGGSWLLDQVDGPKGGLGQGARQGIAHAKNAPPSQFDQSMFYRAPGAGAGAGTGSGGSGANITIDARTTIHANVKDGKDLREHFDSQLSGQVDRAHRQAYAAVTGGR